MALLPREQCFCLTCLGPTDPHRGVSVTVHTVAQRKGVEAHGLCSHSPISHTGLSYTLTTTLMEVTQASPTAPFYMASWVQRSSVFFPKIMLQLQPLHYSAKFPEGASVDAWWQMKPEQKDWGWSKATTTTAWFFKPHIPAAVWNHPQRKKKKNDHASSMQL